jgi:RNA polymerase sigma factor (sigma-70 family)
VSDIFDNPRELIARVYAYAAYRTSDSEAEEVVSETFERALRYRDSFDPRRGDVVGWLIGIARRVIADVSRMPAAADVSADRAVEGHEVASVERIALSAAVATLDARDREIIALRFGADMTAREIGRVLSIRPNTVEVAIHRALAKLRNEIAPAPAARTVPVPPAASDAAVS